ncbi:hypothetical protein [Spirosoma telluris]|uniref:hypothetical protein n=1 Tax=Spirosoma telluris TaxID=2183553 RepID=UPI002FC3087B
MQKNVQLSYKFFWTIGFMLVGLIGFLSPVRALTTATIPTAPATLTLTVSSATICSGTSTSLTASGCPTGGVLRWSTAQTGAVITVAPKQTTAYTAICDVTSTSVTSSTTTSSTATSSTAIVTTITTTTATATVQVYSPILITSIDIQSPLCNGGNDGMVSINSSGGEGKVQYQLGSQPFKDLNVFGNLIAGTYPIVVKDAKGCTVQSTVDLKQPPAIIVSTTVINTKCVGGEMGPSLPLP